MTLVHLFLAVLIYLSMIAGFWWSAHYLAEEGLKKQAVSWARELDELGTPLYFSGMPTFLEQVRSRARHSPDILYARYYEAGSLKVLGQYVKTVTQSSSFDWLSADQVRGLRLDRVSAPLIISRRSFFTVDSIRVLAPIQTRSLPVESLFDLGDNRGREARKTIGYLDIGVDLKPSRELIVQGMLVVSLFLGMVLLAAVGAARYLIRSAMRPLLNLQAPLSRLARGDLNVVVADDSTYREIATINQAMRASIVGLRQRDREMEVAMRGKLQAELANEAKSQFLAHLSHEVRTPLNGMLGFLGLLARTPLNEIQRAYLRDVEISSQRLLAMLNDILDFSRIEAGKLTLERAPLNLRAVIEECLSLYSANAHAKGLDLTLLFARDVPVELVGDAGRLSQVLCNLFANAVKFTHRGGIEVAVTMAAETDGDAEIRVSVSDSGIGIPQETLGKLFRPFSQADDSITRRYGGSGLGLVISRKVVEMMGGELGVESVPGQGSTFHFSVRLRKQDGSAEAGSHSHSTLLEGRGVLIITPSTALESSLREDLLALHLEDDAATSSEAGLAVLAAAVENGQPFDFVILDGAVGDLSPSDFVSRIQADPRLVALHLILLLRTEECLASDNSAYPGFGAVLSKPVKGAELHAALFRAIVPLTAVSAAQPAKHDILWQTGLERPLRVLLADDDEISRKLVAILLGEGGVSVDQVQNGAEAVKACRANDYDLVLMDIQMPEMDGLTATREIRELDRCRVPIVALTANALHGDRERFIEAGMNGYLPKPVNETILFDALAEWCLNGRESPHQTGATRQPPALAAELLVLDAGFGIELAGGDAERWRMLLELLAKDLPGSLASLEEAYAESRLDGVGRLAHKLRGAAHYCSAPALRYAAEVLEQACGEGMEVGEIRSRLDWLKDAAAALLGRIESGELSG
jgi:signal transduction histidine kinase/CheY-like chemotaxis protein